MPIRILSIFGTRPEAIKMAPVIQALEKTPGVESLVCVTAQHRQMLDQVLNLFHITPDIDLDIMHQNQSLAQLTANIFTRLDPVLDQLQPDWVLVQGDTTTVMVAAMLAYYKRIRLGHIEAGLRTGNKWQPFPEEINRRVASVVTDLHFAPTEWSRQNLIREGCLVDHIVVTGNPVIDAMQKVASLPDLPSTQALLNGLGIHPEPRSQHQRLILVTSHRRENFGQPLENICAALRDLAKAYGSQMQIVYPVHLNPNVQTTAYRLLSDEPNITLLPPMDYIAWIQLLKRATLLLTDSGGLQEEAPGLGVPVLVLRQETERIEGVKAGTVRLVGTETTDIIREARRLLDDPQAHTQMVQALNPYGDGHAAERILNAILNYPI